jgi:DNA-binding NarL/FixJ family response regulator
MTFDELKRSLTPREQQIVAVLCEGYCNKKIARRLNISEGTVRNHLVNIFRKLNIAKRTTLMAMTAARAAREMTDQIGQLSLRSVPMTNGI